MSTPIGDAAAVAAGGPNPNSAGIGSIQPPPEPVPADQSVPVDSPVEVPQPLPPLSADNSAKMLSDNEPGSGGMLQAQTDFISAQMSFIHTKDLAALVTAQEQYVMALTKYITPLGGSIQTDDLGSMASAQETYILALTKAATNLGIL